MTVSILPIIEQNRVIVRKALTQYYQDKKNGKPWDNVSMTPDEYRLSLENRLEELDREIETAC